MVVFSPVLPAKDFCLQKSGEEFYIEERITEACVEALSVRVLIRLSVARRELLAEAIAAILLCGQEIVSNRSPQLRSWGLKACKLG